MIIATLKTTCSLALLAVALVLPAQAFAAYTCSNPAICIAVCGKKTCGKISARNADMMRLEHRSSGASMSANMSKAKPYTCSNPAICIAVCGKKTCG